MQERFLQRLLAKSLKLVSVFLTELLGTRGRLRHVRLARYSPLNHLLKDMRTKKKYMIRNCHFGGNSAFIWAGKTG